jgi:dolichol-phosphate mannosyltransferase
VIPVNQILEVSAGAFRMKNKISIVIPVYFNAGSLPSLFTRLQIIESKLDSIDMELDLIFVDDGSGDTSLEELLRIKETRPNTKIIKLTRNFGVIYATKCALRFATGDCFMILAADLQDPPELILEMVNKWRNGSKFVVCTRISREDPFMSKMYSALYYWMLKKLVISDYPEGGFDMALMDKALLPPILDSSKSVYTPLLAYWLGYKPTVIGYHRAKREHGSSRWTFRKKFKAFVDVMLGFSVTPIRIISAFGVFVAGLSFVYGSTVVINALLGNVPVAGFASLASLISFLLGLVIIMLGIIGEYLWRIFDEINKRPEAVIDEVY